MIRETILSIPKRYYVTLLMFISLVVQTMNNSTSIVVVDVTSNKTIEHDDGTTEFIEAEYHWTSTEIGIILSMNAFGHFFSGFMGVLINKLGGVTSYGISKTLEGALALVSPLMIRSHIYLFIANRFVLGFLEGFSFISTVDIFTRWVPLKERVRAVTLSTLGYSLGSAINYPISGFIIQNFGWKYIFYFSGIATLAWTSIWITFVSNDPATDKFITEKERTYLAKEITYVSKDKIEIPYRSIFTSVPVYALLNEFFIQMFTSTFMHILLPLYVKDVYNADIQTVGLISGIPEIIAFVIRPLFAYLADHFRSKANGNISKVHKSFLFWGQSLTVVFFFIAAIWNNLIGCIVCLTLARISFGVSQISYGVILIDVCGQYAAFMQSIAVFFLSTAHFLNPLIVGFLVPNHSQGEWNIYFMVISFLTMYGVIVFIFIGSGELQPWAKVSDEKKTDKDAKQET